jgi:DNA-binding transcriptional ArsR family regulator
MASSSESPPWYQHFLAAERDEASELYGVLADERRRVLLSVLDQSDTPLTESELARLVASHESENTSDDVTSTAGEEIQISLHHVHLPELESHGLIERTDEGSVTRTQHPFWTSSDFRMFLTHSDAAPATTTTTLDSLTNRQRRAILACLHEHRNATVRKLAEVLVDTPVSGQEHERVLVSLRHRHLPKLEAANVIEVDATEDRVHYTGNPVLEKWFTEVRNEGVEQV